MIVLDFFDIDDVSVELVILVLSIIFVVWTIGAQMDPSWLCWLTSGPTMTGLIWMSHPDPGVTSLAHGKVRVTQRLMLVSESVAVGARVILVDNWHFWKLFLAWQVMLVSRDLAV